MKSYHSLPSFTKASFLLHLSFLLVLISCAQNADIEKATYKNPIENEYLKNWLILGPIAVSETNEIPSQDLQAKAFETDEIITRGFSPANILSSHQINNKEYSWKLVNSDSDIIDLTSVFGDTNFVYAYALAEIELDKNQQILVGLGSDDAVKLWVNGQEVHKYNVGRPIAKDDDLIELKLNKGKNQLLLKIQNFEYAWGFCLRPIGGEVVSEIICNAAEQGDIDKINTLLKYNPDLNYKSGDGLTAWQKAKIKGREDVAKLLVENGAIEETSYPEFTPYIESKITTAIPDNSPGYAVLIAKDGKVIYKNGFGYANIEEKIEATTSTKFRIGSITKQFIATAILRLQEEGKLTVQDKLSKFMPDYPRGNEVTIHHLLTHTSGIQSFTDRADFIDHVTEKVAAQTLIDSIKTWEFNFNPGEQLRYNNSGYFILAEIIEIVSGKWYGNYLQDEFFTPLNMTNTGIYINETPPDNSALGYNYENNQFELALNWDMSWAGGAGSIYSTVEDLFLWNEAIFNGKVLSSESLLAAHTPVKLNNGKVPDNMLYGYGWFLNTFRGKQEIAHGGGLHGFISYIARYPEENITVVNLTNTTPAINDLNPAQNAYNYVEYLLWEELEPQKSFSRMTDFDTTLLNDYTGRYDYGNSMIMTISTENGKLFAQMSGQPKFEIFPSEKDEFFWKVVEARIKFVRDESNVVTQATHFQGGNELLVKKLPNLNTLPITKDIIGAYIGKYKFDKDFFLEIMLNEQNLLFVQATGQPMLELFRIDEDNYQPKEININLRFYMQKGKPMMDFEQGTVKKTIEKEK